MPARSINHPQTNPVIQKEDHPMTTRKNIFKAATLGASLLALAACNMNQTAVFPDMP